MKTLNDIKQLVEENALAFATSSKAGVPHCIAVGFVKVVSDSQLLVTDNYMNETVRNIQENPNVSLAVWSRNWQDDCIGFELRGKAEYLIRGEWFEKAKKMPENKEAPCKGVILVGVTKIKKLA